MSITNDVIKPGFLHAARVINLMMNPDAASSSFNSPEFVGPPGKGAGRFKKDVSEGVRVLSPGAKRLMSEFNIRTKLGRRMVDINPDYKNVPARAIGHSVEYLSGVYDYRIGTILLALQRRDKGDENEKYITRNRDGLMGFLHETGHALDYSVAFGFSSHPAFAAAYAEDVKNLKNKIREKVTYFLAENDGGQQPNQADARSEVFAEFFARKTAGKTERKALARFDHAFPKTSRIMDQMIKMLEREMKNRPTSSLVDEAAQFTNLLMSARGPS